MSLLGDKLLTIHRALAAKGIPHAFGGAIALAYCTRNPRGTSDIDVNLFLPPERADDAVRALPKEVAVGRSDRPTLRSDGQVRLWWDTTPVDVFLSTHPFHDRAAAEVRQVPFEGSVIPVLSCFSLGVFKAMFDRSRDWADIEEMVAVSAVDPTALAATIRDLLGEDHRITRLEHLLSPDSA